MPIVEAMASGAPVVASSHASLDEACGDVAVRADPDEPAGDRGGDPRGARPARRARAPRARARAAVHLAARRRDDARGMGYGAIERSVRLDAARARQRRHGALRARRCSTHLERDDVDVEELSCGRLAAARRRPARRGLVPAPAAAQARGRRAPLPDVPRAASGARAGRRHGARPRRRCAIPSSFNRVDALYARTLLRRVLRAAARVLAVSEFTKREVVELAGVPRAGSTSSSNARRAGLHAGRPARRRRLRPGGRDARAAQEPAAADRRDGRLGSSCASSARRAGAASTSTAARRAGSAAVTDDELAALLPRRALPRYPSLYEGFGIPVLEAMLCGTPVVTSARSAMEEVAGGAAELVDPREVESIAAGSSARLRGATSCARPASCARGVHLGVERRGDACAPTGRRRMTAARRRRRRRARPPPHRRGDVRPQPAARAAGRRARPADRRGHPPPRARAGRRRADRAAGAVPGAADGVVAAAAAAAAAARLVALPARAAAGLPRPGGRDGARPALRARPRADGAARPVRLQDASCRAPRAAPTACSPSRSARSATWSSSTGSRRRR